MNCTAEVVQRSFFNDKGEPYVLVMGKWMSVKVCENWQDGAFTQ